MQPSSPDQRPGQAPEFCEAAAPETQSVIRGEYPRVIPEFCEAEYPGSITPVTMDPGSCLRHVRDDGINFSTRN